METIQAQSELLCSFISDWLNSITKNDVKKLGISMGLALGIYYLAHQTKIFFLRKRLRKRVNELQRQRLKAIQRVQEAFPSLTTRQGDIIALDFPVLRQKLQDGELTSVEVLEAFQAKAIEVHRDTNCITSFVTDAITRAKGLDSLPKEARGPLHGMPISLKEHIHLEAEDCTVGVPGSIRAPSARDAELVRILKHLGAVPFCRTNLPQTCLSFDCSNPIFGQTLNPHDLNRSPGGSSGGEGALIGGGGSVLGFGSDLGGSVRIPALFCGITSLKPTAGRIPSSGQGLDGGLVGVVGVLNTLGFLARSAASIEDCLQQILRDDKISLISRDARFCPVSWNESRARNGQLLRIGWYDFDGFMEATPGMRRAVREAITVLQDQGHTIVRFCPPGLAKVSALYTQLVGADNGVSTLNLVKNSDIDWNSWGPGYYSFKLPLWLRQKVSSLVSLMSPMSANMLTTNQHSWRSAELWELNNYRLELTEHILREWDRQGIDVVIAPGLAMPAQPIGYPAWELPAASYTCVYNVLNFPAGSIPVSKENAKDQEALEDYPGHEKDSIYGWIKEGTKGALGMSLNVQVVGRPWHEELVLRVMKDIETHLESTGQH